MHILTALNCYFGPVSAWSSVKDIRELPNSGLLFSPRTFAIDKYLPIKHLLHIHTHLLIPLREYHGHVNSIYLNLYSYIKLVSISI